MVVISVVGSGVVVTSSLVEPQYESIPQNPTESPTISPTAITTLATIPHFAPLLIFDPISTSFEFSPILGQFSC